MSVQKEIVIEPWTLSTALEKAMGKHQFVYVTAPTGWGKTSTMRWHFRTHPNTYISLWDDRALEKAANDTTGLILLDDCHILENHPRMQEQLMDLLRGAPPKRHVLMLSRAPLPDWLFSFQLIGLLTTIQQTAFVMMPEDIAALAAKMGLELSQDDILRLYRESKGFPVAVRLICLQLAEGMTLTTETINNGYGKLFAYFDDRLFRFWDIKIRRLLLAVSFFDSFTLELARVVTGDNRIEQSLERLLQSSSFLRLFDGNYMIQYPVFRIYLQRKVKATWSMQEQIALYTNAGMYYQLSGNLPAALECYTKNGNHAKVSELLVEHSKLHPGHGAYYELRKYYRSLPEKEILESPELMSAMSILCSLTFDVDESEKWYTMLKDYADTLSRRAFNYREVQGLVHYLDIALPHRGSLHMKSLLMTAFDQIQMGSICLPEFSVTSNLPSVLRGGKDFSNWVLKDKLLYRTIGKPIEMLLGRQGIGLPDIALAESRYEKGESISDAFLTLFSQRMDIQHKGTSEMEFVLVALMAKCQCDQGDLQQAICDMTAFRTRMKTEGEKHLLPNLDAMLCRFALLNGGEYAYKWFVEEAPDENDFFIMERYRYLTKVRCYLQHGEYLPALALLGRLLDYFTRYDRVLDRIETLNLLAICRYRMESEDWREHLTTALELAQTYGYVAVFSHEGAALLPLLKDWEWSEQKKYLSRVKRGVQTYAVRYPDYLSTPAAAIAHSLTKRELEVLRLIQRNKTNEEIWDTLYISENTLKTHIRKLYKKLGVTNRTEAKAVAERLHIF